MTDTPGNYSSNPSRRAVVGVGSALFGTNFLSAGTASPATAALVQLSLPEKAPQTPPPGYTAFADQARRDAVLAVSLEPPGGSPTGQPTGPVIGSGKLTNL
jgi:hypothetical protein